MTSAPCCTMCTEFTPTHVWGGVVFHELKGEGGGQQSRGGHKRVCPKVIGALGQLGLNCFEMFLEAFSLQTLRKP